MATYAALISLMSLIQQIQNHPRPPITLDNKQVQSLTEKIAFLEGFLETYNTCNGDQEVDRLRSRIADAAYKAEDVIEIRVVNRIRARSISYDGEDIISLQGFFENHYHGDSEESDDGLNNPIAVVVDDVIESHVVDKTVSESTTTHDEENISSIDLYRGLEEVIEEMDFIEKDVMEIIGKMANQDKLQRIITTPVVSSKSPSIERCTMVGFDDILYEVLDKLTGQQSHRQIISISGMGGIGKTTLARNVYTNPLIEHRFDVRAWITISQEYNIREILLCLKNHGNKGSLSQESSDEDLGLQLYQSLSGRRYLIIMDDMWSAEAWDKLKFFFPDNNNGSRIIITTRISKLARDLDCAISLGMSFLDVNVSWDLFCEIVLGEQSCPDELEQIGKRIVKNCKGLPLSIVVIGGLLAKSKQTQEYWEYIADNLNSVVNLDDNERCLKILHTSYNQLPIHLKPCFIYMGSSIEDEEIDISKLIKQWVSEGFLKPRPNKILEEIAEEYLTDLIDRNLILVSVMEWSGRPIFCGIHDLLRDLCLREAHKDKFLYVTSQHCRPNIIPQIISTQRRLAILESTSNEEYQSQGLHALGTASLARSLICNFEGDFPSLDFRLLRLLKLVRPHRRSYSVVDVFQLINSRYLDLIFYSDPSFSFCSSLHLFWNLQTLIITSYVSRLINLTIPQYEFWVMRQLRHVQVDTLYLTNPCSDQTDKQDDFVMENLQTLSEVCDFILSEEVVKRIPNVKKLEIYYGDVDEEFEVASHYCLNNLDRLHKLEELYCFFPALKGQNWRYSKNNMMSFPNSLKKLFLNNLNWEDVNIKIGSLPFLERLILSSLYFTSSKWETVEGQFSRLKHLEMYSCSNLEWWMTESTHFPCLEYLHIWGLNELMEIPSDIGEIPTLKSILLEYCSDSAVISARKIAEEQEEIGNEDLQVRVAILEKSEELVSSGNFHVELAAKSIRPM